MTVGIVLLVHDALDRAEQVTRHWVKGGCPVVIHVDKKVPEKTFQKFVASLSDLKEVSFSGRYKCLWGTWGIVAGTQAAAEMLLRKNAEITHVYLASGSCLPLRPVAELRKYLAERPRTDFIESATTADVHWTIGGLDRERFTLRFPFPWKTKRKLFDGYVKIQRAVRFRRKIPDGITPHLGSQWWCLTRRTLSAILQDPERPTFDRYFKRVWIPDESYFQTLARQYSSNIESRSLTLSKFDYQGKPHIFYDDHLQLLRRSDCFVARKIWPDANRLYRTFLTEDSASLSAVEPNPGKIDRIFAKAVDRRLRGRHGLYMQSRWPYTDWENGVTAQPYSVFEGFAELFENFESWISNQTVCTAHGHLFAPDRVEYKDRQSCYTGALTDEPRLRDYDSQMFLSNLIWNTRGERQGFQFGPHDNQDITWKIAKDPNATVSVISGCWAVPLFQSNRNFADLRQEAALLQKIENEHINVLRSPYTNARVKIWTMAEFVESPMEILQVVVNETSETAQQRLTEVPRMHDLTGFGQFLQNLKNQGMHPYLMGDFPVDPAPWHGTKQQTKPYLVG